MIGRPEEASAPPPLTVQLNELPSAVVSPVDRYAELLTGILFALRRLDDSEATNAERHLRNIVHDWTAAPNREIDGMALTLTARSLRRRPEPMCRIWADMVDAIRTGDEMALAAARYRNGESSQTLAREFGVSDTAMLALLNRRGVPIRRQGGARYDDDTKARAVAMYAAGATSREVAAEFGTAKNVVIKWVRAAGGDVRRPSQRPVNA